MWAGPVLDNLGRPLMDEPDCRSTGTKPRYTLWGTSAANCSAEWDGWLCNTASMWLPAWTPTAGILVGRSRPSLGRGWLSICWPMLNCNLASCCPRKAIASRMDSWISGGNSAASVFSSRFRPRCKSWATASRRGSSACSSRASGAGGSQGLGLGKV